MICVPDASAVVEVVLQRPRAEELAERLSEADWVTAPTLFIAEITNTMWKYHSFEDLPIDACESAIDDALAIPDTYANDADLARETFALAAAIRRPAYDAFYLVLARRHDGELLTLDQGLRSLARKQAIRVAPDAGESSTGKARPS
ncbi:MAG: type II toxin-antitoxin system VapC family toxin [Kiritimatiellae bacterium]|nr:type II toxin-antitoxin system VapC family toxin [Kiritimatiellia bacterium]